MANFQDGMLRHHQGGPPPPLQNPMANTPRTIKLKDLMDTLIQKAYHDLLILAEVELVSRSKSDMDKKISIMAYLSRTRNYFIRFLALLEWSSNMEKVDTCFSIINYLEQQSSLFVETADVLARMSRETLANSKLPCYQVSFAVDVLNSRSCPRMPSCIKEKIVPPDPLTQQETDETLKELGFALWNRLITSDRPPAEMRNYIVRRGRVIFTVDTEFEVTMTVMGEDKTMPFRILDLKILVKNRKVGEGRPLVHPQQVMYLIQLLQSRIVDNEKPLEEVYDLLHTFCQSLKLEVLYSQLSRHMIGARLDYFQIESYTPGRELKISYWRGVVKKGISPPYTIAVTAEPGKRDLIITQIPHLDLNIPLLNLDIGTLLMSVIHTRVKNRLVKLEADLAKHFACTAGGFPYLITIPLYSGSSRAHSVQISIDYYTGNYLVYLQQYTSKYVSALKDLLDSPVYKVEKAVEILLNIRLELVLKLAAASAIYMQVQEQQRPNLYGGHPFERYNQLGPFKTVFRFQKKLETTALLGISSHKDASCPDGIRIDYHVLMVEETKFGLKVLSFTSVKDKFAGRTGEKQVAFITPASTHSMDLLRSRLKAMKEFRGGQPVKKERSRLHPVVLDNFEEMVHYVMLQIMFAELRTSLKANGHTADATVLDPLEGEHLPSCLTLPVNVSHPLVRSCVFRRVGKIFINTMAAFYADIIVHGVPFQKTSSPVMTTFSYDSSVPSDKIVDTFSFDFQSTLDLLRLMRRFKLFLDTNPSLAGMKYEVKYNLKTVKILYGPDLEFAMTLSCDRKEEKLAVDFYGAKGGAWNPHRLLKGKLTDMVNTRNGFLLGDFSHVFDIIAHTTPLTMAARNSVRAVGIVKLPRSLTPQVTFQFIPLSLSLYALVWKGVHCICLRVQPGPKFIVTDVGGTEVSMKSTEQENRFLPIPGLKLCVETALEQNLLPDNGNLDQELHSAITRFFSQLRGYPVHVVLTSTF